MSPAIKLQPPVEKLVANNITIKNAKLAFRNFTGAEGRFNPKERRNFCVLLDKDVAIDLKKIGWNIKWLKPREEGDDKQAYIQVTVSYKVLPPKIVIVTTNGKSILDEDSVNVLDWAEIENVDLIIRPYSWNVNGQLGLKAYVKTMYVTIVEDELDRKYRNVPDDAISALIPPEEDD
jgi:hypothetical protein